MFNHVAQALLLMSFHQSQLQPEKKNKEVGNWHSHKLQSVLWVTVNTCILMQCERRINSCSPIASEIDVDFAMYVATT